MSLWTASNMFSSKYSRSSLTTQGKDYYVKLPAQEHKWTCWLIFTPISLTLNVKQGSSECQIFCLLVQLNLE